MAIAKITTKGMHCKSCEILLKEDLESTNGITKAEPSFKEGNVAVEYDDSKIKIQDIKKVILRSGYKPE